MTGYEEHGDKPFLLKAAILAVVAVFLVLGLIGLILPVIPGILFLGLAALLLSKISTRFADYLEDQVLWQKIQRHWRSASFLSFRERIRLGALWTIRELVRGLEKLLGTLNRPNR